MRRVLKNHGNSIQAAAIRCKPKHRKTKSSNQAQRCTTPYSDHQQRLQHRQAFDKETLCLDAELIQIVLFIFQSYTVAHEFFALRNNMAPHKGDDGIRRLLLFQHGEHEQLLDTVNRYPAAGERTGEMFDVAVGAIPGGTPDEMPIECSAAVTALRDVGIKLYR